MGVKYIPEDVKKEKDKTLLCIALIAVAVVSLFSYTFRPSLDMNGDTSQYYIYATSLAQGEGYAELGTLGHPPANAFPAGYPLLMAPLRMITDSIVAQKILNGVLLCGAAVLLFLFLRRIVPQPLALTAVLVSMLNYRVLQFASIMMSETSYLFFSALALWLLGRFGREDRSVRWWKSPNFWLLVIAAGYACQIRTQGVALPAAVIVWMLCRGRWRAALGFAAGFFITTLPWEIRNRLAGLGASRYIEQLFAVDAWRPEQGMLSLGGLAERAWDTLQMLISKAIPNTVTPYFEVDYHSAATLGGWIAGAAMLAVIFVGFRRMKGFSWFFAAYTAAMLGIICLWSAPSGNRYITTLVPLLEIGLIVGLYTLLEKLLRRRHLSFSPMCLLVPAVLLAGGRLSDLARENRSPLPPQAAGFVDAAKAVRNSLPPETVVCSRKPSVFYVYAGCYVCNFRYTEDDAQLIRGLIDDRVDYVVIDQLGYAATGRYLLPAILAHPDLFEVAAAFRTPPTYLLRFNRVEARRKIAAEL